MGAEMAFREIIMAVLLLGQGGLSDMADLMDTKAYWAAQNVQVTLDTMAAEIKPPKDAAGGQAPAVRRLMAIRALGELKQKEALQLLEPLLKDEAPFVAEYAKQAIAAIEGKPFQRPGATREKLASDVAILPSGCGVVMQLNVPGGQAVDYARILERAGVEVPATGKLDAETEAMAKVADQIYAAIRDGADEALKDLAVERVEGWKDRLPGQAEEIRDGFSEATRKPFELQRGECVVVGDCGAARFVGPKELNGACLDLYMIKSKGQWKNFSLRKSTTASNLKANLGNTGKHVGVHVPAPDELDIAAAPSMLTDMALKATSVFGNFRLQGVTFCVAGDMGGETGFVITVLRGSCDSTAVRNGLRKMARDGVETVGDVEVFRLDREMCVACPSDDRVVILLGPNRGATPVEEVVGALKTGKGGIGKDAAMTTLLDSVDRTKAAWAVVRMSETYKEADLIRAFDAMTLTVDVKEPQTVLTLVAKGGDAEKIADAVKMFDETRKDLVALYKAAQMPGAFNASLADVVDFIGGLTVKSDGKAVTVSGTLKGGGDNLARIPAYVFLGGWAYEQDLFKKHGRDMR